MLHPQTKAMSGNAYVAPGEGFCDKFCFRIPLFVHRCPTGGQRPACGPINAVVSKSIFCSPQMWQMNMAIRHVFEDRAKIRSIPAMPSLTQFRIHEIVNRYILGQLLSIHIFRGFFKCELK